MDINKQPHKQEGKIIYWWTGEKWLIRETCKTKKEADELLKRIKDKQNGTGI